MFFFSLTISDIRILTAQKKSSPPSKYFSKSKNLLLKLSRLPFKQNYNIMCCTANYNSNTLVENSNYIPCKK